MRLDRHVRVQAPNRLGSAVDLEVSHIPGRVNHLPLKVREGHDVIIDNPNGPESRPRQILNDRRAKTARADDENARRLELQLPGAANIAEDDVAGVTFDLIRAERHRVTLSASYRLSTGGPRKYRARIDGGAWRDGPSHAIVPRQPGYNPGQTGKIADESYQIRPRTRGPRLLRHRRFRAGRFQARDRVRPRGQVRQILQRRRPYGR